MDALVVGAGAMGRWLGQALRDDAPRSVSVAFVDPDRSAAHEAADTLGGRVVDPAGEDTNTDGEEATAAEADTFDVVCIAVPLPAVSDAIAAYTPRVERAIVDITGQMAAPLAAMREHAPDRERASFHPLFAPESEPGNVPVVVDEDGPAVAAIRDTLAARDNHVFETTAAEHDEAMETVQARTHAAILAFGLAAEPVDPAFHTTVSEPLADLVEQVTGGEPRVYADVQAAFDGAEDVAAAAEEIADADSDTFESMYRRIGEKEQSGREQNR